MLARLTDLVIRHLPDLIFPEDRSWLVSTLWDESWMGRGGPRELVDELSIDPFIRARQVDLD